MQTIPIYDAKARFSEIRAVVQGGEEVCVTKRGEPIARIVAFHPDQRACQNPQTETVARFAKLRELRKGIRLDGDIKSILTEGRD